MLVISVCLGVICVMCTLVIVIILSNCSLVLKALITVAGMLMLKPLLSCLLPSLLVMHSAEDTYARRSLGSWQRCVTDARHS